MTILHPIDYWAASSTSDLECSNCGRPCATTMLGLCGDCKAETDRMRSQLNLWLRAVKVAALIFLPLTVTLWAIWTVLPKGMH